MKSFCLSDSFGHAPRAPHLPAGGLLPEGVPRTRRGRAVGGSGGRGSIADPPGTTPWPEFLPRALYRHQLPTRAG